MKDTSRRSFLRSASLGAAGTWLLNNQTLFLSKAFGAEPNIENRQFFIQLYMPEGLNAAYFFDARPLAMTKVGKIQNYLNEEPFVWQHKGTDKALATRIVKPLAPLRDYFSIVNGVFMAVQSDGHEENINFSLTSSTAGGEVFFSARAKEGIVDSLNFFGDKLQTGLRIQAQKGLLNFSSTKDFKDLTSALATDPSFFRSYSKLIRQLNPQLQALATKNGKLAEGSRLLKQSFDQIPEFSRRFVATGNNLQEIEGFEGQIEIILNSFRMGLADNAILAIDGQQSVDFHEGRKAKENCEKNYSDVVSKFAKLIQILRNTPVDPKNPRSPSFYDVTTFMMTSEFNRTMRQLNRRIDETGTDHNTLGNSVWIGGGRIKGGRVVGATDLTETDNKGDFLNVSNAHIQWDPQLLKVMGKPFDFKNQRTMVTTPGEYSSLDYIQYGSVINTVLQALGSQRSSFWKTNQSEDAPELPLLSSLIS
jgi:hypothetical protein